MLSFGIGGTWLGDADPVVGKRGMEIGRLDFGHVAGDAIFCGDGAGGTGVIFGFFFGGARGVARETVLIIGGEIVRKRLVGIVARHAGNACVACGPALAVFKTIGGEADVKDADFEEMTGDDILPSAMAGAAKIDGVDTGEVSGVED